jgi:hypothetical protein
MVRQGDYDMKTAKPTLDRFEWPLTVKLDGDDVCPYCAGKPWNPYIRRDRDTGKIIERCRAACHKGQAGIL